MNSYYTELFDNYKSRNIDELNNIESENCIIDMIKTDNMDSVDHINTAGNYKVDVKVPADNSMPPNYLSILLENDIISIDGTKKDIISTIISFINDEYGLSNAGDYTKHVKKIINDDYFKTQKALPVQYYECKPGSKTEECDVFSRITSGGEMSHEDLQNIEDNHNYSCDIEENKYSWASLYGWNYGSQNLKLDTTDEKIKAYHNIFADIVLNINKCIDYIITNDINNPNEITKELIDNFESIFMNKNKYKYYVLFTCLLPSIVNFIDNSNVYKYMGHIDKCLDGKMQTFFPYNEQRSFKDTIKWYPNFYRIKEYNSAIFKTYTKSNYKTFFDNLNLPSVYYYKTYLGFRTSFNYLSSLTSLSQLAKTTSDNKKEIILPLTQQIPEKKESFKFDDIKLGKGYKYSGNFDPLNLNTIDNNKKLFSKINKDASDIFENMDDLKKYYCMENILNKYMKKNALNKISKDNVYNSAKYKRIPISQVVFRNDDKNTFNGIAFKNKTKYTLKAYDIYGDSGLTGLTDYKPSATSKSENSYFIKYPTEGFWGTYRSCTIAKHHCWYIENRGINYDYGFNNFINDDIINKYWNFLYKSTYPDLRKGIKINGSLQHDLSNKLFKFSSFEFRITTKPNALFKIENGNLTYQIDNGSWNAITSDEKDSLYISIYAIYRDIIKTERTIGDAVLGLSKLPLVCYVKDKKPKGEKDEDFKNVNFIGSKIDSKYGRYYVLFDNNNKIRDFNVDSSNYNKKFQNSNARVVLNADVRTINDFWGLGECGWIGSYCKHLKEYNSWQYWINDPNMWNLFNRNSWDVFSESVENWLCKNNIFPAYKYPHVFNLDITVNDPSCEGTFGSELISVDKTKVEENTLTDTNILTLFELTQDLTVINDSSLDNWRIFIQQNFEVILKSILDSIKPKKNILTYMQRISHHYLNYKNKYHSNDWKNGTSIYNMPYLPFTAFSKSILFAERFVKNNILTAYNEDSNLNTINNYKYINEANVVNVCYLEEIKRDFILELQRINANNFISPDKNINQFGTNIVGFMIPLPKLTKDCIKYFNSGNAEETPQILQLIYEKPVVKTNKPLSDDFLYIGLVNASVIPKNVKYINGQQIVICNDNNAQTSSGFVYSTVFKFINESKNVSRFILNSKNNSDESKFWFCYSQMPAGHLPEYTIRNYSIADQLILNGISTSGYLSSIDFDGKVEERPDIFEIYKV